MGQAIRAVAIAALLWGCGAKDDQGAPPDAPSVDAAVDSTLTIRLFTSDAFVDGETANASFVTVQDGEGAWTELIGDRGVYRVALHASRYGVAIGCSFGTATSASVSVLQRAVTDGLEVRERSCMGEGQGLTVLANNAPDGSTVTIAAPGNTAQFAPGGVFETFVHRGTVELFYAVSPDVRIGRAPAFEVEAPTTKFVDLATAVDVPEVYPLSVELAPGEVATTNSSVSAKTGFYHLAALDGAVAADPAARTVRVLPAALRKPDDLVVVSISAGPPVTDPEAPRSFRTAARYTTAPGALTLALPAVVAAPTVGRTAPAMQVGYTFHPARDGLAIQSYRISAQTVATAPFVVRSWVANLSSAWIAGADELTYRFPDLPTFTADYGLSPGLPIRWVFSRTDQNPLAGDGRVVRTSFATGTFDH